MWRMVARAVAVGAALVVAAGPWLLPPAVADDTPACGTQDEWQQVDVLMKPWRVEDILTVNNWYIDTANPDTFARGYNLCNGWQPDGDFGKVWYDTESRFSIRKDIVSPGGAALATGYWARVTPLGGRGASVPSLSVDPRARSGYPGRWDDTCWGRRVTLRGTRKPDQLQGGDGPDVIFSYAAGDTIIGGRGNDRICARWGEDFVNAGHGYDRVKGSAGLDVCLFAEVRRSC